MIEFSSLKPEGTSTTMDLSLIFQKLSKTRLGMTMILAYYAESFQSLKESSTVCIYFSIQRAEGPVDNWRLLRDGSYSFRMQVMRLCRKSYIYFLSVWKPLFLLTPSDLFIFNLIISMYFFIDDNIVADLLIYFENSIDKSLMIISETTSAFS